MRKRIQHENAANDSAIDLTESDVSYVACDEDVRNAARIVASRKRKLVQLKQAGMMMKRREQCLKHVTIGTLVSCKMDPRDFKSPLGLQAIVWEISDNGAGGFQVVTTHGLIINTFHGRKVIVSAKFLMTSIYSEFYRAVPSTRKLVVYLIRRSFLTELLNLP